MDEAVWLSTAMVNTTLTMPMRTDNIYDCDFPELYEGVDRDFDGWKRNKQGEPLPADQFPKMIWATKDFKAGRKLADLFHGFGYLVVSARCAEVIRGCDMGHGHLYPVQVLWKDRVTPMEGEWFCINYGNVKSAIVVDQSPGINVPIFGSGLGWLPSTIKDYELTVTREALRGPDIWIDSQIDEALFISDRLAKSLRKAKISSRFGLRKCVIV